MFKPFSEPRTPSESLWKHGDFLRLWSAQTISVFGDQFTALAIPLIAALMLHATALQMGILIAVEQAPLFFLSLFAGVWVDRLPRRTILITCDLGRGVVLLAIPLAALMHTINMTVLYAVSSIVGVLSVFYYVSYQAFLPSLVGRTQLVDGNSKLEATRSLSDLAGPGLAGAVIQFISAPIAIALDALSFLISGGITSLIRRDETHGSAQTRGPILSQVREGLAFLLGNRFLRPIAGCSGTWNFFNTGVLTLYILFATRDLALGPAKLGMILSLGNICGLLGVLGAGRIGTRIGVGPAIVFSAIVSGFGGILIVLATPRTAFPLLVSAGLLTNFIRPVYNINQVSLRQAITPHRLQGRMNATMRFLILGAAPLGALMAGWLGGALGLRHAMTIMVAGTSLPFLWVVFSPVRGLHAIPEAQD